MSVHQPIPEPVTVHRCSVCRAAVYECPDGTWEHALGSAAQRAEARERTRQEQQRAADSSEPYSGNIQECQASVPIGGRAVGFHRCRRRPTRVTTTRDGQRLAVCGVHARDRLVSRYRGEYMSPAANEVVE
jgi:hypothetical protein